MNSIARSMCVLIWTALMSATALAADTTALDIALGFENETIGLKGSGAPWIVTTPGWTAEQSEEAKRSGDRGAFLKVVDADAAPFGNLLRGLDATPYRGKRIAFRSMVRVTGDGRIQPWLRVDRPDNARGAFDNMHDRPLLAGEWKAAVIEADVHDDALQIVVGFMGFGIVQASIDDVVIEVIGAAPDAQLPSPPRPLTGQALENVRAASKLVSYIRFFHPTDELRAIDDWGPVAIHLIDAAEPATDAKDLAHRLGDALAEIAPAVSIWPDTAAAEAKAVSRTVPEGATEMVSWRHIGAGTVARMQNGIYRSVLDRVQLTTDASIVDATVDVSLGNGVSARIPARVYANEQGTLPRGALPDAFASGPARTPLTALNRSTRLASVALAWGVFQHFYPYFDVVTTDWDAALSAALASAATDGDGHAFLATLRRLVAALHDGHGGVYSKDLAPQPRLPLKLGWIGPQLIVLGACGDAAGHVTVGDEVLKIGDESVADCAARAAQQISFATDGWLGAVSPDFIVSCPPSGASVSLQLRTTAGVEYGIQIKPTLECTATDVTLQRPANGAEVAPGIRYFNLDRTESPALKTVLDELATAQGVIFDLRGYPGQAAYDVIERLIDEPSQSARWTVPIVTRPDRADMTWFESGRWRLVPRTPKLPKNVAFLTDGRAISYAESIMGIVEAYKLGAIVGATTAGTNGNINPFVVPGGYSISWTGMRVLKHDGSQHHGVGIAPTVPVTPTQQGIAEGRDEVLEAAVALLGKKQ